MATYQTLRDRALALTGNTGVTDITTVAEYGLEEAMKYVASRVYLFDLIKSATYTWQSSDTSVSIEGSSGFNASDYSTPVRLYVNDIPYDMLEYFTYKDLKKIPGTERLYVTEIDSVDARPSKAFAINPSKEIELDPVSAGDVLTLYYKKQPAPYGDGTGTPEIPSEYDHILVNGAILYIQAFIEMQEVGQQGVVNIRTLLSALDPDIRELDIELNHKRARTHAKISHKFWLR
ncbi:MAG: hypothetical protein D6694_12785 [Gammaproteobacteria bacterium]|nr:MAG: hypothetical protein D6694_12785 [Gammaproteobacteria bacterium]